MVVSAVVSAGVGLVGASKSAKAAKSAANRQAESADAATQAQMDMYYQNREDTMPWLKAGSSGLNNLSYLLGITPDKTEKTDDKGDVVKDAQGNVVYTDPFSNVNRDLGGFGSLSKSFGASDFQTDPGYQFRMDEANKALQRSQAAKGGLLSGAAAKELTRYNQGAASDEYMNAYNRFNTNQSNLYNKLAGLSGTGQQAANTLGTLGQNTATNVGNNMMAAGNAQAAGQVGAANAWSTGLGNASSGIQSALLYNKLFPGA